MKDARIDYEAKGKIYTNPITVIFFYILAAALLIMGIVLYFTAVPDIGVIIGCGLGTAVCVLIGVMQGKLAYFWDSEKFTVIQPCVKPVTYSFDDIANASLDVQAITLIMKNGKRYIISRSGIGTDDFIRQLRGTADDPEYPTE